MNNRLEQLLAFYHEDPTDPFNLYGLALEYLKTDPEKSRVFFETLLRQHPAYLPTYYHAGHLLAALDSKDEAIQIFKKGIALAKESKDYKTLRELQSAFDELTFE